METQEVAVIGAGPSGMAAALKAAEQGSRVTLFERNPGVGRKLLVTGSGRCNLTNRAACGSKYACADQAWMDRLLGAFGVDQLLDWLGSLGIPAYATHDGWYYPLSESAQSVVEAFGEALHRHGVKIRSACQVTGLQHHAGSFFLALNENGQNCSETFQRVIVAAGGKAYPSLGSRGELFPYLEKLGHTVLPLRPALAPLLADLGRFQQLQGLRFDAGTSLWHGKECLGRASGNLIVTQKGFNGPAVMDLSHLVSARDEQYFTLGLDLLHFTFQEYESLLQRSRQRPFPARLLVDAFFPPKAGLVLLAAAEISPNALLQDLTDSALNDLNTVLRKTRFPVKGVSDFDTCQVAAGGVPVTQVEPLTLASRQVSGLFLVGETLDVVGPCGGYNLTFAFGSGALAGIAAGKQ